MKDKQGNISTLSSVKNTKTGRTMPALFSMLHLYRHEESKSASPVLILKGTKVFLCGELATLYYMIKYDQRFYFLATLQSAISEICCSDLFLVIMG